VGPKHLSHCFGPGRLVWRGRAGLEESGDHGDVLLAWAAVVLRVSLADRDGKPSAGVGVGTGEWKSAWQDELINSDAVTTELACPAADPGSPSTAAAG